jgi:SpoVK/Ycf46/Vps4 family AAA+-type ATPase
MNKTTSEADNNKKHTFNINKVICISLKSHNEQQLKAISELYRLDFNALVTVKATSPKIWVEAGGDYVIASVNSVGDTTVNSIFCPITKKEKDALLKITPIKTPKMPKGDSVNSLPNLEPHIHVKLNNKNAIIAENDKLSFNINKVICISLKSHNEQQLKAISEVYKLDFNGLVASKEFSSKIWVESGGDYAIAFITIAGDGKAVVNSKYCPITKKEKDALLKITPIKTPKMPKGDSVNSLPNLEPHIDVKLNNKNAIIAENDKLSFNINKVICISLKSHNEQQLKAISEVYKLDFNGLLKIKECSSKIWVEAGGDYVIAFSVKSGDGTPEISDKFCPITKREKDALLKITPIKTPKIPKAISFVETGNHLSELSTKQDEQKVDKPKLLKPTNLINEDIVEELDKLIGLTAIKSAIKEQINYINFTNIRKSKGIDDNSYINLHSVFTGNPGTGKTTVIRLLGKIYQSMGVMKSGHIVEVNKANLIGMHIGETEANTLKKLEEAKGGILFIDEAYSLVTGAAQFGQEVINTIITEMTNEESEVTIIVAGYPDEMTSFIESNPGLKSRFTKYFHFEDYQPDELLEIAESTAKSKNLEFTDDAIVLLKKELTVAYRNRKKSFGNARYVVSLVTELKQNLAQRIMKIGDLDSITQKELRTITDRDILHSLNSSELKTLKLDIDEEMLKEAMAELNDMVGLAKVKSEMNEYIKLAKYYREIGKDVLNKFSLHAVFIGNPGTGKTTVARILAKIYKALGLLERGHLIEGDRQTLVKGYVGQTAEQTRAKINEAMGGVLFIDEAYGLVNKGEKDFGQEAIEVLLKDMEDKRGHFALIVAGYTKEMQEFLESNPGLKSRFEEVYEFDDYNLEELYDIANRLILKQNLKLSKEAADHLIAYLNKLYYNRDLHFGNGRIMRHMVEGIIKNYDLRKAEELQKNGKITSPQEIHASDIIKLN